MNTHILLRVLNYSILKKVDMFLLKTYIIQRAKTMNKSTPSNIKKIFECNGVKSKWNTSQS